MQFIAVDWSGRSSGAAGHIAVAVVRDGALVSMELGRTGMPLADYLRDLAKQDEHTVVGLDFAFSLPAWYLEERGFDSVRALWRAAGAEGEQWVRATGPFWGRPGVRRPALPEHFRRTELAVPSVGGISPKSAFQVGGAGAVGTGSIRGMPFLLGLVDRGFHVWPFEGGWPLVIEIYPRILTGPVVKSSATARRDYLSDARWRLEGKMVSVAGATEDTFDAAVSALVMAQHGDELRALEATTDPQALLEGAIWFPTSVPVELPHNVTPYQRSYWVSPGKLLAGSYPGDKNPATASDKLEGMVAAGIRHVVNLMEESERDREGALFVPYQTPFEARGITGVRMPIRDFHIPPPEEMVAILDEIDQSIAAGAPTFVHCWGGKGRTGTVVGCWLIRHGMAPPERAVDRIKDLQALCGGLLAPSPESEEQRAFVRAWNEGR